MNARPLYPDDEHYESVLEERMADLFAEAVTRLEDGEPIASILASLPPQDAREIQALLLVADAMTALQQAPVPVRTPQRKAQRRAEFINAVALERSRQEIELPAARRPLSPLDGARLAASPAAQAGSRSTVAAHPRGLLGLWGALQDALTIGQLRLAPLVATLAVVFGSAFGLWRVTQASLPGDLTYPLKAWVQMMNLGMTDPELREAAAQQAADTIQADFAESARRAQERAAGAQGAVHRERVFLIFEGFDGRLLKFGDIRVVPSYQPDPASPAALPMEISGNLQPGDQVWLTVQILPGQADIVQGVRAEVQQASEAATTPTPVPCTPRRPAGWGYYTVQRGDTLAELAARSGAAAREIAGANCLESDVMLAGQLLFLPMQSQVTPAQP